MTSGAHFFITELGNAPPTKKKKKGKALNSD